MENSLIGVQEHGHLEQNKLIIFGQKLDIGDRRNKRPNL